MFLLPSRRKFVKDRYNSQPADDDDGTLFSGMAFISQLTTTTAQGVSWDKGGLTQETDFVERMKGGAFFFVVAKTTKDGHDSIVGNGRGAIKVIYFSLLFCRSSCCWAFVYIDDDDV